jgi:AAA family ATP:ADP antiporter
MKVGAWESGVLRRLRRMVDFEPGEARGMLWAFSYYFCLLCSYYILRPIRDEMGIAGGVDKLQWLFMATFLAMLGIVPLFGWLTSRVPRKRFLPYAYVFFIGNMLVFYGLFRSGVSHAHVARVFFVWVSVFNLFVVSVFWSFMTDIFSDAQSRRLFGFIAAGGSAGALTGPVIAGSLAHVVGVTNLLLFSAAFLVWVLLCIKQLASWESAMRHKRPRSTQDEERVPAPRMPSMVEEGHDVMLSDGLWDGIRLVIKSPYLLGVCALILLFTTLSTFLYFQQALIVEEAFSKPASRTAMFAAMDFSVNALTLFVQVFLTGRIVAALGLPWALAIIPLFLVLGFGALAVAPVLSVFVVVQVLRRSGNYALMKPAREMLYVILSRDEKYKAKNFIDTAVYRGGDAISAWLFAGLRGLGLSLGQTAWVAVPIAGLWAWVAFRLGQKHDRLAERSVAKVELSAVRQSKGEPRHENE